jgi:membrane associated rhomboid family serine protease
LNAQGEGPNSSAVEVKRELVRQVAILASIVALLWLLEGVDQLILGGGLDALGIRPRTAAGLRGVLFAPFLHGDFAHLAANTLPFVVLGLLVMLRGKGGFFVVAVVAAAVSGLGVWLFGGSRSIHLGLSGVIFGFLGYLLGRGLHERRVGAIVLALIALVLYGGALWGLLPLRAGVSWQGHLFGFLGGWLVALAAARRRDPSFRGR